MTELVNVKHSIIQSFKTQSIIQPSLIFYLCLKYASIKKHIANTTDA